VTEILKNVSGTLERGNGTPLPLLTVKPAGVSPSTSLTPATVLHFGSKCLQRLCLMLKLSGRGFAMPNEPSLLQDRLSAIVTRWTLLRNAHGESPKEARVAQERLLQRYGGAIRRYLLGCTRNPDQADELYQEFAIKFIQGGLQGADPDKGRFRHYLKGVLFHLLADQHQKKKRQPLGWHSELPEPADGSSSTPEAEAAFQAEWRAELLANAWTKLEAEEEASGQPWFTVLSYRRDHPDDHSEAMAQALSEKLGKPMTAAAVRQSLHRARERFADVLLDQVVHSLAEPSVEALHEELVDLKLVQYCEVALERYQQGKSPE